MDDHFSTQLSSPVCRELETQPDMLYRQTLLTFFSLKCLFKIVTDSQSATVGCLSGTDLWASQISPILGNEKVLRSIDMGF